MTEYLDKILRYMQPTDAERKLFGEVLTPLALVSRMLDSFDESDWSDPTLKWLDPCAGIGNFPLLIYERLMRGLAGVMPDVEERRRHVLEEMIHTCELQPKNAVAYRKIVDPDRRYRLRAYTGDFLSDGFRQAMSSWGVERFHRTAGYPPYGGVDQKFLWLATDISDQVLLVMPTVWLFDKKGKTASYEKLRDKIDGHIVGCTLFNGNYEFGIRATTPCQILHINSNKNISGIVVKNEIQNRIDTYTSIHDVNIYGNVPEYYSVFKKIKQLSTIDNVQRHIDMKATGNYYINMGSFAGDSVTKIPTKIVTDCFYTLFPRTEPVTDSVTKYMWLAFNTEKEAKYCMEYLTSNFARFALSLYKTAKSLHRKEPEIVPWFDDFSKFDGILRGLFTKEELDFMDQAMPVYYT